MARATAFACALALVCTVAGYSQQIAPSTPSAAQLELRLRKLDVLASVLYVAAHPDDENTDLLATLAQGRLAHTTYLSITRGDGGQNLIGTELGPELGLIRTHELLEARSRDGAEQRFTRAIDFGYTKSVEEALEVWGREETLGDVVRVIRQLQPDVIALRFPGDGRGGHGQHTASAVLATEAFAAAADPQRFPEQIAQGLQAWQATRIVWDVFKFFGANEPAEENVVLDVGAYSTLLGSSFTEVSARSRSMHRSQGFGASGRRGSRLAEFEHRAGTAAREDLLDDVDTTWERVGAPQISGHIAAALEAFRPSAPHRAVPSLLEARAEMLRLEPSVWRDRKLRDVESLLLHLAGVRLDALAPAPTAGPGDEVQLRLEAINRSPVDVQLQRVDLPDGSSALVGRGLVENAAWQQEQRLLIPQSAQASQPYWLRKPSEPGRFTVDDPALVGLPETVPFRALFHLAVDGQALRVPVPILNRTTDRVYGERNRPLVVAPQLSVSLDRSNLVFADTTAQVVEVAVAGERPKGGVEVTLAGPGDWRIEPATVVLEAGNGTQRLRFEVTPPAEPTVSELTATARSTAGVTSWSAASADIDYPHMAVQTVLRPATLRAVRVDLDRRGERIGYVEGAGDKVPEALRQVGYEVALLSDDDLTAGDLSAWDAIVVGIRAYNTRTAVTEHNDRLLAYVEGGGTLVVQYNTASRRGGGPTDIGPYPFTVSRDRVSVETAPVELLLPDHPVLTSPNRIALADFDGWVQERGLYFPNQWDERFAAPIGSNDPGEPLRTGGLLVAEYGRGIYIYTGYSFFRELPAAVPGALRLFVNLVSARQSDH